MSRKGTNTAFFDRVIDGIAVVTLDHYPMNALGIHIENGLKSAIREIESRSDIKGVVVRGVGKCFCAGADIAEFSDPNKPKRIPLGRVTTDMIGFESIKVPVVAAIHGYALGGGLELALGCHYRVINSAASVGLPEVNIGLLPGGQGTQRLPRIMGADNALKMMTSGQHIPAKTALEWGIVDSVIPSGTDLLDGAIAFAKTKIGQPPRRIYDMPPPSPTDFAKWRKQMKRKRRGEPAPLAIIDCVEGACKGPAYKDGLKVERKLFGKVMFSPESIALRYMFFAERAGVKVKGLQAKPKEIKSVGIIGAGLMGGGIAMCCANIGISVVLLDINDQNLERGFELIQKNYNRSVKRGSRTQEMVDKALSLIKGSTAYSSLSSVDLVVEAVFEEMSIKKKIFKELDRVCKPGAFLCTNTSALDIDEIASVTSRPEYVMGTHFFSPANVMKLLENVRGAKTNDLTIASMMEWGRRLGKWAILVGNCDGFVGNRMLVSYNAQATQMLEEGATPTLIDTVALKFGMRMGPLAMGDLVGLDLGMQATKKRGDWNPTTNVRHALVESGRCGQKSKKGFFDYNNNKAKPSTEAAAIIKACAKKKGVTQREISDQEVIERLFFPLINEGFHILEEGMAQKPSDIDVCYIHGYSFPRYRGGPMCYADKYGLPKVLKALEKMGVPPSSLLKKCVDSKLTLAKYWKKNGAAVLKAATANPTSHL